MNQGPIPSSDLKVRPAPPSRPTGDAALEALRRRLIRLAVKMIWNRQDAEEIVQEAFTLATTRGPSLPYERYTPWMFRTVTNLCLNLRRRRKPEPMADWIDVPQTMPPESRMQRAEQLERLRAAVAELPDRQRTALILRTMEQMSYTDVAEIMALSVAAVRSHVHFARRRLAEMLGAEMPEARS